MKDNSKLLLKILSAVFMIFGVIAVVVTFIALIKPAESGTGWLVTTILLLLVNAAMIIIGVMGLKKSDDAAHANFFIAAGFIFAALELLGMIIYFTVWGLIGFALFVLYIIGGYMLRSAEVK